MDLCRLVIELKDVLKDDFLATIWEQALTYIHVLFLYLEIQLLAGSLICLVAVFHCYAFHTISCGDPDLQL